LTGEPSGSSAAGDAAAVMDGTVMGGTAVEGRTMRVLVVEDHAKLANTMATGLRRDGMAVDVVFDGHDALEHLAVIDYDVVVLDRDIPGVHGDEVCRALVAGGSPSRVLMLTASGTVQDRVEGLGIGADDYLAKPCDFTELLARVRALGRRPGTSVPPTLTYGDLQLDPSRRVATRAGNLLPLNPKEFAVLEFLLAAPGVVVSAEDILEHVWDEAADPFSQAVRTTISRLRAKLGDPPLIETVAKAGYRMGG
jgi:DNA-binding response OmpR family regulator